MYSSDSGKLEDIWEKALEAISEELAEISFKTWFEAVKPISIDNNIIYLGVPSEFEKGILGCRYCNLMKKVLRRITDKDFEVKFFTGLERLK